MAFTQADLDKINAAIVSGVKSITFADGRKTEYQSLEDMLSARDVISREIVSNSSSVGRRRLIVGRVRTRR